MVTVNNPRLTSVEIEEIWNSYMTDSLSTCVLNLFLNDNRWYQELPIALDRVDLSDG